MSDWLLQVFGVNGGLVSHYVITYVMKVIFLRKLFKNPISERWGKQICLN